MKYLKKFNESSEEEFENALESIKSCFQEFSDEGWKWKTDDDFGIDSISLYSNPNFWCKMEKNEELTSELVGKNRVDFNFSGVSEDGELSGKFTLFSNLSLSNVQSDDIPNEIQGDDRENLENFIVAIKRLTDEIPTGFKFRYGIQFEPNFRKNKKSSFISIEGKLN